ncbi:hypothetical protein Zmor_011742 [Zophobas morio]|uniref:Uncharacterized protein n=1 Tax=Zophobas morio TaxID=2755281 RepID=A0AA38HHC4_9CUCU|nr:hypothetical protein Zmor_011742 [Zophobas morio]
MSKTDMSKFKEERKPRTFEKRDRFVKPEEVKTESDASAKPATEKPSAPVKDSAEKAPAKKTAEAKPATEKKPAAKKEAAPKADAKPAAEKKPAAKKAKTEEA